MSISIKEFVQELWSLKNQLEPEDILHYGHRKGWLEDQDEVYSQSTLDKRTAARILHQFMKIELKLPDAPDITSAQALQDLYTCRVCASHIAQVYVQKLMDAEEIDQNGNIVLIFNNLKPVSREEVLTIIQKISNKV